jgi:hypothetical protein
MLSAEAEQYVKRHDKDEWYYRKNSIMIGSARALGRRQAIVPKTAYIHFLQSNTRRQKEHADNFLILPIFRDGWS